MVGMLLDSLHCTEQAVTSSQTGGHCCTSQTYLITASKYSVIMANLMSLHGFAHSITVLSCSPTLRFFRSNWLKNPKTWRYLRRTASLLLTTCFLQIRNAITCNFRVGPATPAEEQYTLAFMVVKWFFERNKEMLQFDIEWNWSLLLYRVSKWFFMIHIESTSKVAQHGQKIFFHVSNSHAKNPTLFKLSSDSTETHENRWKF